MRNPNGYGTVVKLSGNRRKPFCARKTVGFNEKRQPKYKPIGYYATQIEANIALAEYNKSPYDLDKASTTMKELYESMLKRDAEILRLEAKFSESTKKAFSTAFNKCTDLHNLPYRDIKTFHMQQIIDGMDLSYASQGQVKTLFTNLDSYALELDIIPKGYAEFIHTDGVPDSKQQPFSLTEIKIVWQHKGEPYVDPIIVMLYSGWRITELFTLKTEDVNLEEGWMKGGIKTDAGKDRIVPIHPLIRDIIEERCALGEKLLFNYKPINGKKFNYPYQWGKLMAEWGIDHTPHECRHTFRSRLDSVNANKKCIDLMMGHKSKDVGERVYTHKTLQELKEAIELITS